VLVGEQLLPRAFIGGKTMHRGLHLVAGSTVADPYDSVTSLLSSIENSNHIAGAEFGIESHQQGPTEADVASAGFLQEAVSPRVYAPDGEPEVEIGARFAPAIFAGVIDASSVNAAKVSHASR
jgi:hypothetical protein